MLNILELFFLGLAIAVSFTGVLINNFENYIPAFIIKGFRYGSFAYKGPNANFLQVIEMPKSYYRHFYVFSSIFSFISLLSMYAVYVLDYEVNHYIPAVFRIFLERNQPVVSSQSAFLAMLLLTVQCVRRLYETYYLQVFAKSSKMNLSHYLAGIIHYFGCVIAVIGQAPLFCGNQPKDYSKITLSNAISIYSLPLILIFLWAWHEQYKTNVIFANLRKDKKSGKLLTEEHSVPMGRLFSHISSPHRLCEVIMYSVLLVLVPTSTFFCIYLWVLSNQIQTAIQAHEWYKKTFKTYPKNRYAIIPLVL